MKPVRHPSNNRTLGAPVGWDQSGLPVEPLGITDTVIGGVSCVLSFWQPDAVDLVNIAAGRPVGLSIVGRTMPPASLVTFDPEPGEKRAALAGVNRTDRDTIRAALRIASERTAYAEQDVYGALLRQMELSPPPEMTSADLDSLETGEGDAR